MLKAIVVMLIICPQLVYASYINSCRVTVELQEPTSSAVSVSANSKDDIEKNTLPIKGIVISAEPIGRADSGCESYVGKELNTIVTEDVPVIQLNTGSMVVIDIIMEDGINYPMTETVSFVLSIK